MDSNLYKQCRELNLEIDRSTTNIWACIAILDYLDKNKSNSAAYFNLAFQHLLRMMQSVHLESLDISIGYFQKENYKKKYLEILSTILKMMEQRNSRRGFDGSRYLSQYGNFLSGTDVESILEYNWDPDMGEVSLSKMVIRDLIENAGYTEEEQKSKLEEILIKRYITREIRVGEDILIKKGRFELVYLWGDNIYDIPKAREIYFSRELKVSIQEDAFILEKNTAYREPPKNFFGEKIRSIHAVIGKNGSGKSSVFELISNCDIFGPTGFPEGLGEYFLIYKIEDEFFYTKTTGKKVEIKDETLQISSRRILSEVRICKISNVFDLYHFSNGRQNISQVIDLTTQSIIGDGEGERQADIKRVENYRKIVQGTLPPDIKVDRFENKVVKNMEQFSSGERARITLFARILSMFCVDEEYLTKDEQDNGLAKPDIVPNYIFMFDEAELYFHPAWQRKLIKDICDFFTWIDQELLHGNGAENITILLSSNSPFYMSDLPGAMIHRLGYENEKSKETFGQNIYSLLKSKFFMEEGVIGAFAQDKVNHVLKELSDYQFDEESGQETDRLKEAKDIADGAWKEIEYVVDIMGDPFLKDIMKEQPRYIRKINQS